VKTHWPVVIAGMTLLILAGSISALAAVAAGYIGCVIALEQQRAVEHRRNRDG
jgi:hypothetical protein